MDYGKFDQETRDELLKRELDADKVKLIEKFGLHSTGELCWVSRKENAHQHLIFKHNYLKTNNIIGALFRVNRLCIGKLNYFSQNLDQFEPYVYDFQKGFIRTEWWNADFFKHKASGYQIDLRYLQTITEIEKFRELCAHLESFEG